MSCIFVLTCLNSTNYACGV